MKAPPVVSSAILTLYFHKCNELLHICIAGGKIRLQKENAGGIAL
jgi:hypothetical protein